MICRNAISKEYIKKVVYVRGQGRDLLQDPRCTGNAVDTDEVNLLSKVFEERYRAGGRGRNPCTSNAKDTSTRKGRPHLDVCFPGNEHGAG